jgi:hypothetical protein
MHYTEFEVLLVHDASWELTALQYHNAHTCIQEGLLKLENLTSSPTDVRSSLVSTDM